MNDLAATRRERLKLLIEELGSFDAATKLFGISRAKLSRLVNVEQQSSRDITHAEARDFEAKAGKSPLWMDIASLDNVLQEPYCQTPMDGIYISIKEDIPPRAGSHVMKDYGENLFLETWSHRLRINAIRHQGLIAILNVSVWRTGWLSVTAKGNLRADMVADVAKHLRELEEAVNFHTTRSTEEILQFPSDTVMVGNAKAQDVSFLVDPHPAPPSSIQSWLISNQMRRASTYGDLVAVFQVSIWGDDTIRAAFSGFPFKQDAEDVVAKIGQLAAMVEDNLSMYRRRQGIL